MLRPSEIINGVITNVKIADKASMVAASRVCDERPASRGALDSAPGSEKPWVVS
jgi:hypothetical protein